MAKTARSNGKPAPVTATVVEEPKEVALVRAEHGLVLPWIKNLATWWRTAGTLLEDANRRLLDARALTTLQRGGIPTSEGDDLALQESLLADRAALKHAEEHFEPVTGALFKMHRRLTTARGLITKPLEESADIKQRLHNAYTTEQRRLAEEADRKEQERLQREADERKEQELRELEIARVKAEEASTDLSARERTFAELMARPNANAVAAATTAGFKDALASAARLMTLAKVKAAINGLKDAAAIKAQQDAVARTPAIPIQPTLPTRTAVTKASGSRERTTWSAQITDRDALHQACLRGEVPADILMIDEARVRKYAEDLHELIDAWPGVRAVPNTTTY